MFIVKYSDESLKIATKPRNFNIIFDGQYKQTNN